MLLHSATSNFVFLIPLCLIFIGIFTSILWMQHQKIPSILWLSIAAICAGTGLFAQSLIPVPELYKWALLLSIIYLGTFAALAQAIALRFNSQISWAFCTCVFILNQTGIFYYSWIDAEISIRFAINGLSILLIFSHIIPIVYRAESKHNFDQWLKRSIFLLLIFLCVRELYLIYLVFNISPIFDYNQSYIGFLTQFIGLFFQLLFAALLIGTEIQDNLIELDKERNFDDLTGIFNRRSFFEKGTQYLSHFHHQNSVLFMCDIDYFKKVNDQYGHAAGDEVLRFFSTKVSSILKSKDIFARIGGEEFVCILHDRSLSQALDAIAQMQQAFRETYLSPELSIKITASFGVVDLANYDRLEDALKCADQLMYQAKLAGRDTVKCTLDQPPT